MPRPAVFALLASVAVASAAGAQGTRLLRHPAINGNTIAFEYGGDLWVTTRAGGAARRLTATPDVETDPHFSPDGARIAFTRTSNGNTDVYVVPTAGGEATRLTFHPGADRARGWTADGKSVVFASDRASPPQGSYLRLFTVPATGGFEEPLPMPRAFTGTTSPDGKRFAYEELSTAFIPDWYEQSMWRHYRGGRTHPISVIDLASNTVDKLPWQNSNDSDPMWIGNTIYFLSDRNYTRNLFSYDIGTKQVKQLTRHDDGDIMNASAGSDAIVYEQDGVIHLFDVKSGQSKALSIDVVGDFPWARAQYRRVSDMIRAASLSPTGVRAAFEARGDIFTVPVDRGDWRNLTKSPGAHDRDPVWSPDGSQLAWISDVKGDDQLMIGDQSGLSAPRAIALPGAGYFDELAWSPNGKTLVADDNHLNLWTIDVATGKATKIDADAYNTPGRNFQAAWSPDSKWIVYTKSLDSHMRAVFVRALAEAQSRQLTDALADVTSPSFDASGKYLYFLASTDYGPRSGWIEMSAVDRPSRRSVYLAVLSPTDASPLLPESGDEPAGAPTQRPRPDSAMHVDLAGIGQRVLSLDIPPGDYGDLAAGPAGSVFYSETVNEGGGRTTVRLQKYQLRMPGPAAGTAGASTFLDNIRSFTISADRKKLLYSSGAGAAARWGVVATDRPAKVGDGPVNVAALESWVDPRAEWAEIFREALRDQHEYFYDAKLHGADWKSVQAKYEPLVAFVNHRADLTYLIAQTGGELVVGHSYITAPGDLPADTRVAVGLLGADYTVENGHYRIHRVYGGENWNPELRAPLSAPGIQVKEGDYLLEVNGRSVAPPTNVYSVFEGTAGHQIAIRVNSTPAMEGSHVVTVVPVPSEVGLRMRAWVEDNRRKVDELSHGKLAYVWLPNTGGPGYQAFTRYFYTQQDKDGVIVDERYNQGGLVADYIVNELDRTPVGYFATRDGKPWSSPAAGIYGPKVMIVNESAGSGGDALPYMFKLRKIGPIVGTRTWGALVGTTGVPPTMDGGGITAPSIAFYDLNGRWAVENEGVTPDIPVEYDALSVSKGHDPQLERAVQEGMKLLEQHPVKRVDRPPPIDRVKPPTR